MTRRDYELIYTALRKARPIGTSNRTLDEYVGWRQTCEEMAHALKKRHEAFDEERFLRDCGVVM